MAKLSTNDYAITVNGTSFSDHLASIELTVEAKDLDTTSFGSAWESRTTGTKAGSCKLSFHADYAASSVNATLSGLLGGYATVVAKPTSAAVSATNPAYTAVCVVTNTTLIGGQVGDLASFDVTWPTHGTVTGF